ncbi:serine/threonine-protein kinase [Streptosporangium sp. NPDC051023]|uniref:serine/threonine-protein kinase n=1 Tax=Streptosporangium sp. NPDC051023 TaxID=3155410 RepID=UPI003450AA17
MTDRLLGKPPIGSEGDTIGATGAEGQSRLVGRRYRLLSPVGRGGMGVVWHAHDVLLDRDVAVKELILPHGLDEDGLRAAHRRMLREARSAARLSHPGIVTVHDVVEEDGRPWIVMELVRAWSLEQAVRKNGPLPVVQAAEIAVRMLDALRHAHGAGVLHRDIKPGNVLLTSDRVVLTDFGIAAIEGDVSITQTGLLMGSPAYIPPERLSGRPLTYAADLWSFGATLYAAVEGRPPYEGPDAVAVLGAILTQEPNRPQRAGALIAVIEGLLRKNPADRMTAAQVADLLDRVLRSHGSATSSQAAAVQTAPPVPSLDDLASMQLLPPPDSPPGPFPSRIIETPSGPVRVPYDAQGLPLGGSDSPGEPRDLLDADLTDTTSRNRSASGSPGTRTGGHRRGYDALRSPAADLGRPPSFEEPPGVAPGPPPDARGLTGETVPTGTGSRAGREAARTPRSPAGRAGSRRSSRRRAADGGRWMRGGRPALLLIVVCAVAVLAAVAAALFFLLPFSTSQPSEAEGVNPSPMLLASSDPASPSPQRVEVPAGYRTLSAGRVSGALPRGWTVRRGNGGALTFYGPKNSGLSIVVTQTPVADPVTALGRVGKEGLDEYTEVGVTAVPYGTWKAADWEYTYVRSPGAVPMHGLTRYVAVDDRNAYLIAFTAQDLDWDESAELLRIFFATFEPNG